MLGWVVAALSLYLALCAVVFAFQRSLQYFPDRSIPIPAEVGLPAFRTVTVETPDGLLLSGLYAPPRTEDRPTVAHFHGNAGHVGYRAEIARTLHGAGYGVLLAGYRGYGGNPGKPTERGLHTDGAAWLDWLVARGISGRRLVVYGESMGTGIAVRLATERKAAALVLEAPFTSITDVAAKAYPFLPVRLLLLDRFDSLSRIADVQAPLLIIHGERDRIVPVALGRQLFKAAPEPKKAVWLPRAGHNDLILHGLGEAVVEYLDRIGQSGTAEPVIIEQQVRRGTAIIPK